MRRLRAALALLLAFAVPVRAETTTDPLWTMLSTYVLTPDEKAAAAEAEGDARGLTSLQADLLLLSDGFEAFRDEAQVKESLTKLEPRMSPELKPYFRDRASSLDAVYRTLAVTDFTWASRFPDPPCAPIERRAALLESRDGLFQTKQGEASPWLVSLLGPRAEGKSAAQALDSASTKTRLTAADYERRRARARRLTMALASEKAEGAARAKLYCARAELYTELAAHHRAQEAVLVEAARATGAGRERSVFVVVTGVGRAAATMLQSKSGPVLVTDAYVVAETDRPELLAYSEKTAPIVLTASVVRRHPELSLAVLSYSEELSRPGLTLAAQAPSKDGLVTALGHTQVSGLWTKTSGLVTKGDDAGFQTDAAVSAEMSGGPVFDEAGEVAGLLVGRPADVEEGRWPVAIPAPLLARWLDDPALAVAAPGLEVIEDAGTAAILSRTKPAIIEAGLGAWNIPAMGPPPPTPRGVCVSGCNIPSAPSRSYSSYSGGSSYSGSGGAELGQALGQAMAPLVEALVFKGIPALFRGIGSLFKKKGGSSSAVAKTPSRPTTIVKAEPPPKPKPVNAQLLVSVETSSTENKLVFTARVTATHPEISVANHPVTFNVPGVGALTANTDTSGVAVLTVNQAPVARAMKDLDAESAKHPELVNASSKTQGQTSCEMTLAMAAVAALALVTVTPPGKVAVAGGMAIVTVSPTTVRSCVEFAKAAGVLATAACASMMAESSPSDKPVPPAAQKAVTPGKPSVNSVRDAAERSFEDMGDFSSEAGGQPADPGEEPPDDDESERVRPGYTKPEVEDGKLRNIVNDLYKGLGTKKPIGSGSTADAIRYELRAQRPVGGKYHSDKGRQYSQALENWLKRNPNAAQRDREAAKALLDDLQSALGGR